MSSIRGWLGQRSRASRRVDLALAGWVGLCLNSAYLWAFSAPSLGHYAMVALHPVLAVCLLVAGWAPARQALAGSWPGRAAVAVALLGAVLGLVVLRVGAATSQVVWVRAHVVSSLVGALLLAAVVWVRAGDAGRTVLPRRTRAVIASTALAVASMVVAGYRHDAAWASRYRIQNPEHTPTSMEAEARPGSPFFPSPADTNRRGLIPSDVFLSSESCARCHKDIYDQWRSSMHHFASLNNQWYRKSIEYMQDVVGTTPSKWCAGCHDHAVLFSGRFEQPIKHQIDTPEAQAGLACTSCHSITRVGSTMGQGHFEVEYPPLHDLAVSNRPVLRAAHDILFALDPKPHRDTFLKPFHREQVSEFCSACHKVHLDVPVNAYRWFRGFNDYDNWQASGVSGEGARSFYYPPRSQTCADCHMPRVTSTDPAAKDGTVRSHRFAAANTAVPFVNHDRVQLEAVQQFLRAGKVSIDVFGIVRGTVPPSPRQAPVLDGALDAASTFAIGEESLAFGAQQVVLTSVGAVVGPLDEVPVAVRRGESVRLEVVVRTRGVGHFFPGGTVDAFDVWVDIEVVDDHGRTILRSGALDGRGAVDSGAHMYRSLLLDEHGNPIDKRNAWAARSVAYVRLIPPGAADTVHFRLVVPEDAGDRLHVRASIKHRKFSWWNTQWSYGGVRAPDTAPFSVGPGHDDGRWVFTGDVSRVSGATKAIPSLPLTEMAVDQATILVLPKGTPVDDPQPMAPTARERWNDYAIGLLLQGDLKGAESAFLRVTSIDPSYADGWVNVGRARLQEGNVTGAEAVLRQALALDPSLAKTHFFLGSALKQQGRYDEALAHLRKAATRYPRDRVVLNQIGRVLFLMRRFADARVELRNVLAIDPEDLQAHYSLMLVEQGLGDREGAERARVLYERFKADESAQAITGPYRLLNPDDDNERQSVHEHRASSPVPAPGLAP